MAPVMKKPAAAVKSGRQGNEEAASSIEEAKVMKKPAAPKALSPSQPPKVSREKSMAAKASIPPKAKAQKLPKASNTVAAPPQKVARSSKVKAATSPPAKKVKQPPKQSPVPELSMEATLDPDTFRKRPMTPVFAFINEKRDEIAAMPDVSGFGQIAKKGSELFKALAPEEREERQKRFEEEMKDYKEWQSTDEGKAAMMAKRAKTQAAKKVKQQRIGAFAKRQAAKSATPSRKRKRHFNPNRVWPAHPSWALTPPKKSRIVDKEFEAEKRRINKKMELRKEVLAATNPRDHALALAQYAIAEGTIKPSWSRRPPKAKASSSEKQQVDEVMNDSNLEPATEALQPTTTPFPAISPADRVPSFSSSQ